jgi:hypothetical protein
VVVADEVIASVCSVEVGLVLFVGGGSGFVRGWRLALLVLAGVVAAGAGTVLTVAANVATGGKATRFPIIERDPWWWTAGSTLAVAAAGLVVWWSQRWYERGLVARVPVAQRPESWVVDRPAELGRVARALRRRRGGSTVGVTTAVHGAGGFSGDVRSGGC